MHCGHLALEFLVPSGARIHRELNWEADHFSSMMRKVQSDYRILTIDVYRDDNETRVNTLTRAIHHVRSTVESKECVESAVNQFQSTLQRYAWFLNQFQSSMKRS